MKSAPAAIAPELPAPPAVERKEFDVVVPLLIRTFLRETDGVKLNETAASKVKNINLAHNLSSFFCSKRSSLNRAETLMNVPSLAQWVMRFSFREPTVFFRTGRKMSLERKKGRSLTGKRN